MVAVYRIREVKLVPRRMRFGVGFPEPSHDFIPDRGQPARAGQRFSIVEVRPLDEEGHFSE